DVTRFGRVLALNYCSPGSWVCHYRRSFLALGPLTASAEGGTMDDVERDRIDRYLYPHPPPTVATISYLPLTPISCASSVANPPPSSPLLSLCGAPAQRSPTTSWGASVLA